MALCGKTCCGLLVRLTGVLQRHVDFEVKWSAAWWHSSEMAFQYHAYVFSQLFSCIRHPYNQFLVRVLLYCQRLRNETVISFLTVIPDHEIHFFMPMCQLPFGLFPFFSLLVSTGIYCNLCLSLLTRGWKNPLNIWPSSANLECTFTVCFDLMPWSPFSNDSLPLYIGETKRPPHRRMA